MANTPETATTRVGYVRTSDGTYFRIGGGGGGAFLPTTGGTMIGPFEVSGAAVTLTSAPVTTDSSVTMTGISTLTLAVAPSSTMHAATKTYVDTTVAARTPKITAATSAPSSPAVGDIWINTT